MMCKFEGYKDCALWSKVAPEELEAATRWRCDFRGYHSEQIAMESLWQSCPIRHFVASWGSICAKVSRGCAELNKAAEPHLLLCWNGYGALTKADTRLCGHWYIKCCCWVALVAIQPRTPVILGHCSHHDGISVSAQPHMRMSRRREIPWLSFFSQFLTRF